MNKFYMAIDQYGQHYNDLGKYPRKSLLQKLYSKKAEKMYKDKNDGTSVHCGYIITGLWLTLYEVKLVENIIN